jgi:hypothetical protein
LNVTSAQRSNTDNFRPGDRYDAKKVHDDIQYTKEDDEAIDDWVADHVETTWHSLGEFLSPCHIITV